MLYPIRKPKAESMKRCQPISVKSLKSRNIKVANFAEIHPLKIRIVGLNQKVSLVAYEESGKDIRQIYLLRYRQMT
jgi:hypothetical protein